jgi:hypothetical protein
MISKITNTIINIFNDSNYINFVQKSDNTIIIRIPGNEDKYKLTITRVKNL